MTPAKLPPFSWEDVHALHAAADLISALTAPGAAGLNDLAARIAKHVSAAEAKGAPQRD